MALSFNSEQIKSISDEYLGIDIEIQTANQNKQNAIAEKAQHKETDEKNLVFYNHYKNIIARYHDELKFILGIKRTEYSDSNIWPAVTSQPDSVHFPQDPLWSNFIPKITPSNNGIPISQESSFEKVVNEEAQYRIGMFTSGFTGGAVTTSGVSGVTGNEVILGSAAIDVGHTIICSGSGNSFVAKVIGKQIDGLETKYTLSFVSSSSPVNWSGSVSAQNFWVGFSDLERQNFSSASFQMVMNDLSASISSYVDLCSGFLSNQLDALNRNDAGGPEKKEISDAKSNVTRSKNLYSTWKSYPNSGVGGRWTDVRILPVLNDLKIRIKDIGVRNGQILNRLGILSQQADGVISGSGNYFDFFKWIDFRVNRGQGSLSQYYASDLGLLYFNQKISSLLRRKSEIVRNFNVSLFAENPVSDSVKLKSVKGFVVNDSVFLAAKDLDVIKAKIVSIGADNTIKFDSIIPEAFNIDAGARIIKQV